MTSTTKLASSASVFVKISPSGIAVNLVPYGTSMITLGYDQDFVLDPGSYSIDRDGSSFNASVSIATWERVFPRVPLTFAGLEL